MAVDHGNPKTDRFWDAREPVASIGAFHDSNRGNVANDPS